MTGVASENPEDVRGVVQSLRERHERIFESDLSVMQGRVLHAFAAFAALWEHRLRTDWTPPEESSFPWAQVRLSLAALLPGFARAGGWLARSETGEPSSRGSVTALVLAGNTPLLAWSPLAAALLAGHAVFVKQSRDETVWTRLFIESLADVDPELASLIHLDLWPGDDPRTTALVQSVDTVIAYGGDKTLAALRRSVPNNIPFFGFGHAISVGIVASDEEDISGFARDVLMYDQAGCLSPHVLFVIGEPAGIADALAEAFRRETEVLDVPPVTDPGVAIAVRLARDLASFLGFHRISDSSLRWTIVETGPGSGPAPAPVGHGVVFVVPIAQTSPTEILPQLGPFQSHVSSIGLVGDISTELQVALKALGVSRICRAGEMQMPPLDWPNGGKNLLAELRKPMPLPENGNERPRNTQT